jgi:transcriptional regulator with XRE-family HTH domain
MIRLRIREVAEEKGVTSAAELARRTGLAFATANSLWKDELTTDNKRSVGLLTLYRVAKALGVKVVDLYVEEDRLALWPVAA